MAWGAALFSGQYWPALDSRTRIALRYWDTGRLAEYDAEVQFSLMAARVSLCPMQRWLGSSVSLHACAAAEAGLLSARGFVAPPSVVAKDSARVLWAALGLEAWLRVASGQVLGELGLQADAPLAHREFSFKRPERTVHTIPWTGGSITVGAGMAFP